MRERETSSSNFELRVYIRSASERAYEGGERGVMLGVIEANEKFVDCLG